MSYFETSDLPDDNLIEITDLDPENGGFKASLSVRLLRFARKSPFINDPRGRFTFLVYLICAVMLLFMLQPGMPVIPKHTSGTSAQELHYPLAVYPSVIKNTTSSRNVTWIRISNGQVIVVQASPGKIVWHHCKVQRWYIPPKYAHPTSVVCT